VSDERILVVEDERAVARGLEYGLKKEGFKVFWAESGEEALALARAEDPHLALLDIRLPDISGFDVCRALRAEGRHLPILMLTARDEEIDRVLGLELGADDYIVKPYSLREVISRVRAHLRRAYGEFAGDGQQRLTFGDVTLDLKAMRAQRRGAPVELTPTEFRLLRQLVGRPGRVFSREQLIEAVWGYDSEIFAERTVDVHIRHLRQKLEADPSAPRHILTVRGLGYKFEP
jgi:DNA-binding response OmpR family regulator